MENLYPNHIFLRSVAKANLSIDNRPGSTDRKRVEYVLKMSWRRVHKNSLTLWYILKTSWKCFKNVLKTSSYDVLKTSWQDILLMSWRRLENVLKKSGRVWLRIIYLSWSRRLEDAFWKCMNKGNVFVLTMTSWKNRHQDECLLGIYREK